MHIYLPVGRHDKNVISEAELENISIWPKIHYHPRVWPTFGHVSIALTMCWNNNSSLSSWCFSIPLVTYPPLHFHWPIYWSVTLMWKEVMQQIFYFLCSSDSKLLTFPMVWRLESRNSRRPLMYIVRVSSLLLTPLQAVFSEKVFGVLCYYALIISPTAVWRKDTPPPPPAPLSLPFLSVLSVTADPLLLFFCDSTIASNELRRIALQEEWQPLVMFPQPLLPRCNHAHS